ncbi:tetratricopeptide repeat protein [Chitinibacter fontanus]|uniref:Tetratricopeptide repeat protein n=1 Tax=Chitinibacter fontanus TaxID=1737446 RepID=A0A7D5V9U4_9NEIS|nr:tetratricopeptide repeat protein [Chitinibacter fontanus]QLI81659.1 tetratricopeptide repeat protein [Chitinibacter fontanus]
MKDPVQLAQLARAAAQRADWDKAQTLMFQALQLAPDAAALHLNYGNILKQLGRYDEARVAYEQALHWQPNWADAHYNLGNLALVQQNPIAATEHYRATLDANPAHIEAHYNLATILTNLGQFAPAHQHFAAALALNPNHADALHNLGRLYRRQNQIEQARHYYQAALLANSEHALAKYSLGTLDLYEGHWLSGWQGYEARWKALNRPYPATPVPRWTGDTVPQSAHLLVIGEQGFGDMLQFARFLPQLRRIFDAVTVLVPSALSRLLQQSFGSAIKIVTELHDHNDFTHHIPLMSLAAALKITEHNLCGDAYLCADANDVATWQARLPTGFKVGLAWQGNPQQTDNRWRSIPTPQLAPLLAQPGVVWCSLQVGITPPVGLRDDSAGWHDFADTAAYLKNMDLVISCCTATIHLAGALGIPCLLLSRIDADWRWQGLRHDSPWYTSLQIARQTSFNEWQQPIAQAIGWLKLQQQKRKG